MNPPRHRRESGISNAIIAVVVGVSALFALGSAIVAAAKCDEPPPDAQHVYASLGDSVAAGSGSSDPQTTSFVALVGAREHAVVFNVAKAGSTTQDVIDTQLARVLSVVQSGRVDFVTIAAGGYDLAALIPNAACTQDPLPDTCPLGEALDGVDARLTAILEYLRDANLRVPIVLLAYPNFFSGTGHPFEAPAGRVLPQLNARIDAIAARFEHVAVAHPYAAFEGRGDDLTHVLDPQFDPHPNDAGYRVIADAVERALKDARK
ncbi:MAG TPA: SGNH/GDSL hydrolase family protein [Dehalococcoidia bacterium]|jgi:lysophospholipase L1-like esterase